MIPVDQEFTVGDGSGRLGDCLRACVASILELPAADVPHFIEEADWLGAIRSFLGAQREDMGAHWVPLNPDREPRFPLVHTLGWTLEHVIAIGPSPRGVSHAVVIGQRSGVLAHDPHPSRAGLSGEPTAILVVAPR